MTDSTRKLGYGGSAVVFGTQVVVTSGAFDQADAPATLDMLDLPSISDAFPQNRVRVQHADGTSQFTGSLSFDVNEYFMAQVLTTTRLLARNWEFEVGIFDGENEYAMEDCLCQSLTLSGAPGGLINASMSFMGITAKAVAVVTKDYILDYGADPDNQPYAYWYSGNDDVRDWTLSFTQEVSPMFGNTADMEPLYMRAGLVSYNLNVTLYDELTTDVIKIATTTFTLIGFTTSKGYTFNGPTDLGMYSHTFETASDTDASNGVVITT
jgi:hypothetical protein